VLQADKDAGQSTRHLHLGDPEPLAQFGLRFFAEVTPVEHFPVIGFQLLDCLIQADQFFQSFDGGVWRNQHFRHRRPTPRIRVVE
jgi:hypothetical protein